MMRKDFCTVCASVHDAERPHCKCRYCGFVHNRYEVSCYEARKARENIVKLDSPRRCPVRVHPGTSPTSFQCELIEGHDGPHILESYAHDRV